MHEQQQADADSLEDAADGWVDDQYAAEGDEEQGSASGSQDEQSEDDDWDPDASGDEEEPPPAQAVPLSMDELRAQRMRHFAPHEAMDV